jgi:malate:Na+ symporter
MAETGAAAQGLSVMLLAGFLLGELVARLTGLRQIGGTAILCLFVPAALVGHALVNDGVMRTVTTTFRTANFRYFYIACLVAGSILGMPHKVLVQGFLRMFVPLVIGTVAAIAAAIAVGIACGYSPAHTFFFIVVPILGGGLAEGVLPLSVGYSEILHRPQGDLVAMMVPAAMMANVAAIIGSGVLARVFAQSPRFNGNGILVRSGDDDILAVKGPDRPLDLRLMGMGLMLACGFFILGAELAPLTGIPGPVLMIVGAALVKVARILPADAEVGAFQIYKFMSTNLTFGILVAMGLLLVSWPQLVASFSAGYIVICMATVMSMIAAGFFVGRWLNVFPVESAIVTACRSGLGGTG